MFDLLTLEWFLPRAGAGAALGFILRAVEHYAWNRQSWIKPSGLSGQATSKTPQDASFWAVIVLTQCCAVGIPFAYILLLILLKMTPSEEVARVLVWLLPVFTSFIVLDLRELLRRVTRV